MMKLTKYTASTINNELIESIEYSDEVGSCMFMINQLNNEFNDLSIHLEYNGTIDYKIITTGGNEYHAWQEYPDSGVLEVTNGDYHLCNMVSSYILDIKK